jgi:hypothetical protein
MCQYYAHLFTCKHQTLTFARFCRQANLIQTPCPKREVWQTIKMDGGCEECAMWFPEKFAAPQQVMPWRTKR